MYLNSMQYRFFVIENFQHSTDILGTFKKTSIHTNKSETPRAILKKFSLVKSAKATWRADLENFLHEMNIFKMSECEHTLYLE